MRVLFLTDSLSDLDGVGRYAVRLIAALERARPGLGVEVLLSRKHRPTSASAPSHWKVRVALPPDYFFHMSGPRFAASLAGCVPRIALAARRADLVHAIKDYPHSYAAAIGARLAGRPCVATAHGTYSVQPLVDPRHRRRAIATYARLAGLIAVSRFTRERIEGLLPPGVLDRSRLAVVPNAVRAEHYVERRAIGARPWHAHPFTLAMGELKERKGHHLSLAAFARIAPGRPDLHHYVVGKPSGDEYERGLHALVETAGLGSRVHFLGNVSEDEKVDLFQRARLFVHTPVKSQDGGFEGFGIVYLEAAACGTPSIGTRGSGAEDAVDDEVTGLVVEPTVEAVAVAWARLLDDAELHARLARGALERARRSSWDDNARSVLAIYDRVLGERGTRGSVA